jgi:Putative peptidoglycan binding domain
MPLDRELKLGDSGDAVKVLQAAIDRLTDTPQLGQLRDDPTWVSQWKVETQTARYAKATEAAVKAVQQNGNLTASGALDVKTIKVINDLIAQIDNAHPDQSPTAQVDGRVLDAAGRGIGGLDIALAMVSAAGADEQIGIATSQPDGGYVVSFKLTAAQAAAQHIGHLRVTAARDSKLVARSEVLFNAPPSVEGFDLVADAKAQPVGTDFERVSSAARTVAAKAGIALPQIEESDAKPFASLFAAEIGHDPVKVALAASAAALEQQTEGKITAELAYGLASQGVPVGLIAIAGAHPDLLASAP